MKHHLVQCQHSHALYHSLLTDYIWCSRPPNSERDITDTQSRCANRKSYITLNCPRGFQIWRIAYIYKKVSFTNVEIIPLSVLRYFMLRPLVLVIRSFVPETHKGWNVQRAFTASEYSVLSTIFGNHSLQSFMKVNTARSTNVAKLSKFSKMKLKFPGRKTNLSKCCLK